MQKLLTQLNAKLKKEETKKNASSDVQQKVVKKKELEAIVERFLDDWNAQFSEFLDVTKAQAAAMKEQHQKEMAEFDATEPHDLLPQYRQRSTKLIQLREKERALAQNKRFVDAQQTKARADRIEASETRNQVQKMKEDWNAKREQVIAKQKQQMQVFFSHAEATRIRMMQQRDNLLNGYIERIERIDSNLTQMCEDGDASIDQITECKLSNRRKREVTDGEYSYPIARMRPGRAFTSVRVKKCK